jgi:hypothetical protein
MKVRRNQIATIKEEFGKIPLASVTTKDIASFLEAYILCDKKSMASGLRSVLMDIFRESDCGRTCRQEPGRTDANADTES